MHGNRENGHFIELGEYIREFVRSPQSGKYILFDYSSGVNNQPFSFIVLCSCWKNKICRPGIAEPQSQMPSAR